MIVNFFANYPYAWAVILALWQTAELYLGVKKPADAGSVPQLLYRFLQRIVSPKPKGATQVSTTNPNAITVSVVVDGPTWNAGAELNVAGKKIIAGEKPQQVLAEELGPVLAQMAALGSIPADFAGDPATVLNAAALQAIQLEEAYRQSKAHPAVAAPVVTPK